MAAQAASFAKEPVFINLDETSVARAWPQVRGNIVKPRLWFRKGRGPAAKAKLKTIRTAVTHVALVCHKPEVQAVLPQIFIGNEVAFPAGELLTCSKPSVVQFWRSKSSWNSVEHMQRVIREIAAVFVAFPSMQPILILDAAPIHLHTSVLEQGMKSSVWLACVPAGLTWLLQPLDTHVFSLYKAWLRNNFRAMLAEGPVSAQQWLQLLGKGATTFLRGRRWHRAFEADGIIGSRDKLSSNLQDYVPAAPSNFVPAAAPPSEEDLQLILPRGRKTHRTLWLHKPLGRKRYLFLTWSSKGSKKQMKKKPIASSSSS